MLANNMKYIYIVSEYELNFKSKYKIETLGVSPSHMPW